MSAGRSRSESGTVSRVTPPEPAIGATRESLVTSALSTSSESHATVKLSASARSATTPSPSPSAAAITQRRAPLPGSRVKSTPDAEALTSRWTITAAEISATARPVRCR